MLELHSSLRMCGLKELDRHSDREGKIECVVYEECCSRVMEPFTYNICRDKLSECCWVIDMRNLRFSDKDEKSQRKLLSLY